MFFRMLKNDLKAKKGLNVILFVFMIAAATLVFVGAVQLYSAASGKAYTARKCKTSDAYIYVAGFNTEKARKVLDEDPNVLSYVESRAVRLPVSLIDLDNYEETEDDNFFEVSHYLVAQPRETDLAYDTSDLPFYVESGSIVLPLHLRDCTGKTIGDKVRITTYMGNTYEFTISGFYKETLPSRMRYLVNESDYEKIANEFIWEQTCFETDMDSVSVTETSRLAAKLYENNMGYHWFIQDGMSEDETLIFILAAFITAASIFMILIIFMTMRFTMISAIKDEEKEIGTMRAIGADTFSFRWLFAAKYIGFAVIGGMIGVAAGFFLSNSLLKLFTANILFPTVATKMVIGTVSVLFMISLIILFCMLIMKRIEKISVIDAIHGEAGGERFGNGTAIFLHRRKKMHLPFYLAVSDIMKNFKRYIFLTIGYTFGATIILLVFYVASSVISKDFIRYYAINEIDFFPDFNREMMLDYEDRMYSEGLTFWELMNKDLEENSIPAHVETYKINESHLVIDGQSIEYLVMFDSAESDNFLYTEGSRPPVLENEVALSEYSARQYGIHIGDIVTFDLTETEDGGLSTVTNRKELVVTGFLNYSEFGDRRALMGTEYHDGYMATTYYSSILIDEGGEETFRKLQDYYGSEHIMEPMAYIEEQLGEYSRLFTAMKLIISATVVFITILMTSLYTNIFRYEERGEIALLNTLGLGTKTVAAWQCLRMIILTLLSLVSALILINTLGQLLVRELFNFVKISGFSFIVDPFTTLVTVPGIMFLSVMIPTLIKLKDIRKTSLADISEE